MVCCNNVVYLRDLEQLDLSHNIFNHLPPDLKTFSRLKELNISHNRLFFTPIGPSIGDLHMLVSLDLSHNQIKYDPLISSLHIYFNIKRVVFCSDLPREIAQLDNLRLLNLSGNEYKVIPSFVLGMFQLESLDMSHNKVKIITNDIVTMRNLKVYNGLLRRSTN